MIRFERLIVRDSPSRAKRETSVAVQRGQENQVDYYDVTFVNLRKIPNGSLFGKRLCRRSCFHGDISIGASVDHTKRYAGTRRRIYLGT